MKAKIAFTALMILALALMVFVFCSVGGCTAVRYSPERGLTYVSVLQKKSLSIETAPDGTRRMSYNTDSEAAVQVAREALSVVSTYVNKSTTK